MLLCHKFMYYIFFFAKKQKTVFIVPFTWELMLVRKCNVFVPGNMVCCTLVFPIVAHNALTSVSYLSVPHLCTAFKIALHSFCGNSLCRFQSASSLVSFHSCQLQAQCRLSRWSNALQCWPMGSPHGWTGRYIQGVPKNAPIFEMVITPNYMSCNDHNS